MKNRLWDFKFSRRRVWCSELSSGLYCRVKWLSTDVSEVSFSAGHGNHLSTPWKHVESPPHRSSWSSVLLRTTQPSAQPEVTSRQHWYHPAAFYEALSRAKLHPLHNLSRYTALSLSLLLPPSAHSHWPVPSLSYLTTTGHLDTDSYNNSILQSLGLIISDDGGSTYLWNVGRQSFYTAV
jgi:hypothetical protein